MKCKNCKEELVGQAKFCSNCGQKNIAKLNLKYILGSFIDDFFNVDSKFFLTLKYLIFKPGLLTQEYMAGRRVKYVPPIRLYLVVSVLFFFLIATFDFNNGADKNPTFTFNVPIEYEGNMVTTEGTDSLVSGTTFSIGGENVVVPTSELKQMNNEGRLDEGLDSLTADMSSFAGYVSRKIAISQVDNKGFMDVLRDQFSLFLILFLPFFALLYATVFSKNKKGFIGHLIFNLHINSFVILSLLINLGVGLFISNDTIDTIWFIVVILVGQVYLIMGVMKFYERKWWSALYKYFLLLFGYAVLAVVFVIFVFFSSILMV